MTEIYNLDPKLLPGLRLSVQTMVTYDVPDEELIYRAKRNQAEQLARSILDNKDFFCIEKVRLPDFEGFLIRAETMVLTIDEYKTLKKTAFMDGIKHATGYMPVNDRF